MLLLLLLLFDSLNCLTAPFAETLPSNCAAELICAVALPSSIAVGGCDCDCACDGGDVVGAGEGEAEGAASLAMLDGSAVPFPASLADIAMKCTAVEDIAVVVGVLSRPLTLCDRV